MELIRTCCPPTVSGEVTDCVPTCVAIVAVRYDRVGDLVAYGKVVTEPSRTREVLLLLWGIGATHKRLPHSAT